MAQYFAYSGRPSLRSVGGGSGGGVERPTTGWAATAGDPLRPQAASPTVRRMSRTVELWRGAGTPAPYPVGRVPAPPLSRNPTSRPPDADGYRQKPFWQLCPPAQGGPQAPQFRAALARETQLPPQSARPGAQDEQQRKPVSLKEKFSATTRDM